MPSLPLRGVIPHLLRNPLRPLGHSHGKPTPCVSLCAGDAGPHFREDDGRHDGSPVKGHPDAEKSCHRVAKPRIEGKQQQLQLRPQSACPSTLLRDPADGEVQQQKKGFEGFVTHFFSGNNIQFDLFKTKTYKTRKTFLNPPLNLATTRFIPERASEMRNPMTPD